MYAVIKSGGKQYRVHEGVVIRTERLPGEVGEDIVLDHVLMAGDDQSTRVGTPYLADTKVEATILAQDRWPRVIIFKKKRRQNHRRKRGHAQHRTVLRITKIAG